MQSHVRMKGLDPAEAVVQVRPRAGEHTIRTEDLLQVRKVLKGFWRVKGSGTFIYILYK